ncbi:M3 family oligoendopeptidase [Methylocella sp.]|uniref:M3 family oligoendopeptidase n=1 Tax=Methylocella sp. TaxID=1978226 RepID=UPI003782E27B
MPNPSPNFLPLRDAAQEREGAAQPLGELPEWDLGALYPAPDSPEFSADLARAGTECAAFAALYRGKVATLAEDRTGASLACAVRHYEALDELLGRVMSYAGLVYAGDSSSPVNAKFYGDAQEKITAASADLLFFELELNRLDDDALAPALKDGPLSRYRPWIEDVRKGKPHQLSDELEKLFLEKSTTSYSAWNRLFDETIAALRFDVDGESLAIEPTLSLMQDRDGKKREAAAKALGKTLGENLRLFSQITNTLAKDKEISDRWRGFADVADARHLSNRVEREVVDALVSAVRAAYPRLSHRYYRLKAKWFGKDALMFWDRNAPLPDAPRQVHSWGQARDAVLSAYGGFSPKMADIARRFFDERWIDAPVRPGKSPGAFAHPTVPSAHPYVLLNFQGKTRDVMTLAHELGHGVHQVLAAPNGALMAPTPLTLAETASVFGEMLTFRALLARAGSARERRAMLAAKVEDMLNTVVRQIAFYSFERKVHVERRKGELTADQLCDFWMEVQGESLGPAIEFTDDYRPYWAYIPHFVHSPFYVYAYAFGDCLVNSLYGVYRNASEGFAERYFALLSAGGSKPYGELLKPFGLDARDPAFWGIGLSMIEDMIDELEALEAQA